ncbi:phage adsorption protein NrfB [Ruminococcaceae bacterium OttesenSCG-928-A16]|nr:phage adsorption protein NrfB [Ruminococcaceae bacterium OttesenSCG-928-A16]
MTEFVYVFGLVVVTLYLLLGLDDILIDLTHVVSTNYILGEKVPLDNLTNTPIKLLGIMMPAWNEEAVIEQVITNMVKSYHYPHSMYHIFLGVYPNDDATLAKAKELSERYPHVHAVVNPNNGPSNKADNLNQVMRYIKQFEEDEQWRFASITIHDAEDIVHPYELLLTNYLIDAHDALQLPVFPLQDTPTLKNFFKDMTRATYTDEFAENHYRTMVMRDGMKAVVPSAGTGFVLSRKVLDHFQDKDIFPSGSLTEDYKLSLTLTEYGFKVRYALCKIKRMRADGKEEWDYIATRSIFPATFRAAVRQKTRWVYGITMQSVGLKDIFIRDHEANWGERLSVLKDMKAKIANLMVLPGYLAFVYFVCSLFLPLPAMYPYGTVSFWLCMLLSLFMLQRQVLRLVALHHVYGWRYVVADCLAPPIMPLRLVWGNIINFCATLNAWKQYFFGVSARKKKKPPKWNKTDHEFPEQEKLVTFRRNLADALMRRGVVTSPVLAKALQQADETGEYLEKILFRNKDIDENRLGQTVAIVDNNIYLKNISMLVHTGFKDVFEKSFLKKHGIFPVAATKDGFLMAVSIADTKNSIKAMEKLIGEKIKYFYASSQTVQQAIDNLYSGRCVPYTNLYRLCKSGQISWEQGLLATAYQEKAEDILYYMGLCPYPGYQAKQLEKETA